jgi:tetratricopeptide (TPR) repeat protein
MTPGTSLNRTLMSAGLLLASLALAPRAFADTSPMDRAAADALYEEAGKLAQGQHWPEAAAKLEASLKLDPAIGTLMQLAYVYERLGRTASAWSTYHDAGALAAKSDDKRGKQAEQDAKRLEPMLARLLLDVAPENRAAGVEVRRDGTLLNAGIWGSAVPIDPGGPYVIEATGPGKLPWKTTVTIDAKPGVTTVPVPVLQNGQSTPDVPAQAAPVPDGSTQRTLGFAAVGVGGAGLLIGAITLGLDAAKAASLRSQCPMALCPPSLQSDVNTYHTLGIVSSTSLAAGGALAAAGLILVLTAPKADPHAVGVTPVVGLGYAGLAGRF